MYTINTIPRVKCWLTVFTHSLFFYQKYHSFAALTRCKYRMPALSMKYSPYVLFGKSIENATPSQSIQSSRTNATPSSGTSPLASKEVTPLPPPPSRSGSLISYNVLSDFTLDFTETLLLRESEKN